MPELKNITYIKSLAFSSIGLFVDPLNETVEINVLDDGTYRRGNVYGREDVIKSHQFGDLEVVGEDMFSYGE